MTYKDLVLKAKSDKKWRQTHKGQRLLNGRKYKTKLKFEVLLHYTRVFDPTAIVPHCNNPFHKHLPNDPFFTDIESLSIDHINDAGNKHRKEVFGNKRYSGHAFYQWLRSHNYPKGFQVLCMNCQWKKSLKYQKSRRKKPTLLG